MKSFACISSSVRTACLVTSNSTAFNRGTLQCYANALQKHYSSQTNLLCRVASKHQCANSVRNFRTAAEQWAVAHQLSNVAREEKDYEEFMFNLERYLLPRKMDLMTITDSPSGDAASSSNLVGLKKPQRLRSVFANEVLQSFYCHLKDAPGNESIEGFVTLLGICVHFGVDPMSPFVLQLNEELQENLSKADVTVMNLCLLGEMIYSLEGKRSETLNQVLALLHLKVDSDLTATEATQIYALLSLIGDSEQHRDLLVKLHRHTERQVHRLSASALSVILRSLGELQQNQAITLVWKLIQRATRFIGSFRDEELTKLLVTLRYFGQYDDIFMAAIEKHVPSRIFIADPELATNVTEYCLQARCRSKPILEAVAECFIYNAEKYSTHEIARQVVALGRLNYLPDCSSQMFKKLESELSARFSQFEPRDLLEMLHSCIHLERFPLNFVSKVFSHYFLQRLEASGKGLNKNVLGQLTQLSLSTTLECSSYQGPRLPYHYKVKRFSSSDNSFESPMDQYLFSKVKGPLTELLGGKNYFSTRAFSQMGYTIDVEISLDEEGFVLPLYQWEHTHRRIALCLDGQDRFCTNTHHLLGKEATKRRHLQKLGYHVVQIPHFEFEELRSQVERVQYLHQKIFPKTFRFDW